MTKIAIVYHSVHGHTEVIAKCVAQGAASVEPARVELVPLRPEEVNLGRWKNDETLPEIGGSGWHHPGFAYLYGGVFRR